MSRQIVSRWENGDATPRATKVKIICDEFNISTEMLLKNEDSKEDIHTSKTIKSAKNRKKRIIKEITIIMIIALLIYLTSFILKIIMINRLDNKVNEYKKWTNYYAKIESFENAKQNSKIEIWYKDNTYKIISESYSNNEVINKQARYIDCNNKIRYEEIDGEIKQYKDEYIDELISDGKYILEFFPWIRDIKRNKIIISLTNKMSVKKEDDNIKIRMGKRTIQFSDNYVKPISYSETDKNKITFVNYEIHLNEIKDNEMIIKKDL